MCMACGVLKETVVEAQRGAECVHFVVVEHADPVVYLGNVEHLLEECAAFPAVDLGFWPGKAGPGRGGGGATVTTEPMKFVAVTRTASWRPAWV